MCPDEGHGRTGGMADVELAIGDIGTVPDLFGKKACLSGHGVHRLREMFGDVQPARGEFVVRTLTGQEGPDASHARPVEWLAVRVLTVSVTLIPMPGWTSRRFHLQRRVNDLDRAQ